MTAPVEAFPIFEIEEDDRVIPIENSHLSRGRCVCGEVALFAPGQRPRCGNCIRAAADAVTAAPARPLIALPLLGQGHPPHPPEVAEPFPPSEITSRDPWGEEDPAPAVVATLAQKARKAGWSVRVQRSRGCFPHGSTGAPSAPRTLHGMTFRKGEGAESASAYAIRDGDTWSSVMLWGASTPWFPMATVTDLGEYLAADGLMPADWYEDIRTRDARAEQRKKDRANCDKGLHLKTNLSKWEVPGPVFGLTGFWWCELCRKPWGLTASPWKKPKKGKTEAM